MSTPNFASVNTKNFYAFGAPVYFDAETIEANDMDPELLGQYDELATQDNYDFTLEAVEDELDNAGFTLVDEYDGDRSYPGRIIARRDIDITFCGVVLTITLKAIVRSGYYSGATFDWDAELEVSTYDRQEGYDTYISQYDLTGRYAVEASDVVEENWTLNTGLSKIHAARIIARIYSELNDATEALEDIFARHSEKYVCTALFSNGEAVYEKVA